MSGRALEGQTETTISYGYDPLYRVTGASYSGTLTNTFGYSYDAVGNLTVQTQTITSTLVTNYGCDANLHRDADNNSHTIGKSNSYAYPDTCAHTHWRPRGRGKNRRANAVCGAAQ